uniref:Uncharacterized protein n=1 Tax=Cacopsylla melanoneura TaxID=428564 RepID=A0A8D8VIR4_9HEMI
MNSLVIILALTVVVSYVEANQLILPLVHQYNLDKPYLDSNKVNYTVDLTFCSPDEENTVTCDMEVNWTSESTLNDGPFPASTLNDGDGPVTCGVNITKCDYFNNDKDMKCRFAMKCQPL